MGGFDTRELSSALGVEVGGVDFTRPLPADQADELRRLFQEHRLLLVRGQELSAEDHLRLCGYVLPVHEQWGYVSNTEIRGFHPEFNLLFHSDFAFTAYPLLGISLYAVELGDDAAPTRFANTELAYGRLPAGLRADVEGLDVLMLANTVDGREDIPARTIRVPDDAPEDAYIRVARPLVSEHRVTRTPYLLASEQQASHFLDRTIAESDDLLERLFAHMYSPANVYEHEWEVDDLVIWDNLALQHGRRENPGTVRRCLRRVTMSEKSMAEVLAGTVYARAAG